MGQDLLRSEGTGILLFVKQSDLPYSNTIVIEVELFRSIDGVADLDALTDIGGGDLVERTFKADGGIVIDDPFVADEKDFIQLLSGESSDQNPAHGSMITVDGSFLDARVEFMMVVILEPQCEGFVKLLQSHSFLESRKEPFAHGPKETFHLPTGRAIIGFRVDQRDPGLGTASSQEVRGERGRVVTVKTLWDSIGQKGLLEDEGQSADRLGGTKGMTDHHAGVVIQDGTENGLGRAIPGTNLRAMHEICDPEIVDVFDFIGLAHIGPLLKHEPSLLFKHP
jgi:hypothetical protein